MRIVLLTQYYPPEKGAAQVRLQEMAKGLKKNGHDVTVVTAFPNHPTGVIPPEYQGKRLMKEELAGIPVWRTWIYPVLRGKFWKRLLNYFSFVFSSFAGLRKAGPQDLMIFESPPLFLGFTALIYRVFHRTPFVMNISDLWPESAVSLGLVTNKTMIGMAEKLEQRLYRKAWRLSTQTEGTVEALVGKGVPREKIALLPNGVDPEMFTPVPPDQELLEKLDLEGKFVILYAGTMGYAHGLEVAVEAAGLLQDHRDIHFLMVGDGSERPHLEELVKEKALDNMQFVDFQPIEVMYRYYSLSSINLSTLRRYKLSEGVRPSKVFPGLASGKVLLYVGEGEGAKIVEESGGGVVIPPEDPELLAKTILDLKADPDRCAVMGKRGRTFVQEHYAWDSLIRQWLEQLMKGTSDNLGDNLKKEERGV